MPDSRGHLSASERDQQLLSKKTQAWAQAVMLGWFTRGEEEEKNYKDSKKHCVKGHKQAHKTEGPRGGRSGHVGQLGHRRLACK